MNPHLAQQLWTDRQLYGFSVLSVDGTRLHPLDIRPPQGCFATYGEVAERWSLESTDDPDAQRAKAMFRGYVVKALKERANAFPVQGPGEDDVRHQTRDGERVGLQDPEHQEPARARQKSSE